MKEEIPQLKEIMKQLSTLKEKVRSFGTREKIQNIIMEIKELAEILDY